MTSAEASFLFLQARADRVEVADPACSIGGPREMAEDVVR